MQCDLHAQVVSHCRTMAAAAVVRQPLSFGSPGIGSFYPLQFHACMVCVGERDTYSAMASAISAIFE